MSFKIGFDAKRAFHNNRGLGNYCRTLIANLNNYTRENEYYLFTPTPKSKEFIEWELKLNNSHIVEPKSFLAKKFSSTWRSVALSNVIKNYDLDIYHGLSHELPPGIDKLQIKKVVTIHDLIYLRFPEFFKPIDRIVYDKKFRHSCRSADKIIAICEQTKKDIIDFFNIDPSKIEVVYQSVDQSFYKEISQEEIESVKKELSLTRPYILYMGAFVERKNAIGLLQAYASSSLKDRFDLVMAGRGSDYLLKLKKEILKLKLQDNVKILENVNDEMRKGLYSGARVFCFPSFFEGFGLPIVESILCDTPVITSEGSCFPESAGSGALYINPNDIASIANALEKICNDENLSRSLVEKGKEHVKQFSPENTVKKLLEVYSNL